MVLSAQSHSNLTLTHIQYQSQLVPQKLSEISRIGFQIGFQMANVLKLMLLALIALNYFTQQQTLAFAPPSLSSRRVASASQHFLPTATAMSSSNENSVELLPSDETLDLLLDVAIKASVEAGEIILGNAGGADVLKSKANSRDLLTLIDPLCEKVSLQE